MVIYLSWRVCVFVVGNIQVRKLGFNAVRIMLELCDGDSLMDGMLWDSKAPAGRSILHYRCNFNNTFTYLSLTGIRFVYESSGYCHAIFRSSYTSYLYVNSGKNNNFSTRKKHNLLRDKYKARTQPENDIYKFKMRRKCDSLPHKRKIISPVIDIFFPTPPKYN